MRILALETTERIGSVAVLQQDELLREVRLDPAVRTASSLAPAIEEILKEVGWKPGDLELVAVNQGPGSFTGLRQGITMAKALAFSLGIEVLGTNTLESIGCGAPQDVEELHVAIDAQRQQVFAGILQRNDAGKLSLVQPLAILDNAEWLEALKPGMFVSGPVLSKLAKQLPAGVNVLPAESWAPTASAVGKLAFSAYQAGERQDLFAFLPEYHRLSAAEEHRLAKGV